MDQFNSSVVLRWADLDPNGHVRHSVYYDFGAACRMQFLDALGITLGFMQSNHFGAVIFREECVFKRELLLGDTVAIDARLLKARRDGSRWTMQHHIFKSHEIPAAIITLDGAWLDTGKRKLAVPPALVAASFEGAPKAEAFSWID